MVLNFFLYALAFLMGIAFIALVWDYALMFRRWIIERRNVLDANQLKVQKNDTTAADQTTSAATGHSNFLISTHPQAIPTKPDNNT